MSTSVLVTIPDSVASEFINHLSRLKPDISKHITIRVLSDSKAQRVIDEFDNIQYVTDMDQPIHQYVK